MSLTARNWAWRQDLKPVPKLTLVALAEAANDRGVCWPSVATIAVKVGVSTRTVRRVIQLLINCKLLAVEQRYRSDGSCSSNAYRLSLEGGDNLSPAPDRGDSTPGHGCQGDPDTAVIPRTTIGTEKEPPPLTAETEPADRGGGGLSNLIYPKDLLPAERAEAEVMIGSLEAPYNQQVLDEWDGIITAGAIRASPLGCLRALVKRAQEGRFTPERALRVAQARKVRQRAATTRARAMAEMPKPGPVNQDNVLVRRLADMAKRASRE